MKRVLVLICCFWFALDAFSQEQTFFNVPPPDTIPEPEPQGDSICGVINAEWFCGFRVANDKDFDNTGSVCCLDNKTKLYYKFVSDQDVELNDPMGRGISFAISTNSSLTTSVGSSYKLYGPFNQTDPYTELIENGLAVPISSDSPSTGTHDLSGTLNENKIYILEITVLACWGYIDFSTTYGDDPEAKNFLVCNNFKIECENCLPKFQPVDDRYVVSAWVKELSGSTSGALNYTNSSLKLTSGASVVTLYPAGQIIDGWQRIEGIIQTNAVGNLKMELIVSSGTSYFDDIRVFPYDGSMITYVYDPITLRLMAELDERNYAKMYEYDEEGKLVRVKKETEKGIMTIHENRENSSTND